MVDIGRSIVDSLFPSVDPSANRFRLDGRLYEVIGAFEPDRGLFSNFGVDQFACIHVSNFRKTLPEIKGIPSVAKYAGSANLVIASGCLLSA